MQQLLSVQSDFAQLFVEGLEDVSIRVCIGTSFVHTVFDDTKVVCLALQDTLQVFEIVSNILLLPLVKGHGIIDALMIKLSWHCMLILSMR